MLYKMFPFFHSAVVNSECSAEAQAPVNEEHDSQYK